MTDLKSAVDALDGIAMQQAGMLAAAENMPYPAAWRSVVAEFLRRAKERTPDQYNDGDGRSQPWRVRVRLYRAARMDEAEADSDDDLPANAPGSTVLKGLPAVASHLAVLAATYHGQAPKGLDTETLLHRLKSLRPTLSRKGGKGAWRVPYKIFQAGNEFQGDAREEEWLARVDVEKATA